MATFTVTTALADSSTLANFKTWAQPISDALSSSHFNWTPAFSGTSVGGSTANATRITWSNLTSVPTSVGNLFEVWAMNDGSNQTSCPFFMMLDYHFDGSNNHVQVSFGRGYDTTTGALSSSNGETYDMYCTANGGTSATFTSYLSGSTSSFRMQLYTDKIGDGILMAVERSKDSAGADTASYVAAGLLANGLGNASKFIVIPATGSVLGANYRFPVPGYDPSSATFGTVVTVFPVLPISGTVGAPMLGVAAIKAADFTSQSNSSITVTAYGSSHTYKVMNNSANSRSMYDTNDGRILMQYE